MMRIVCYCMTAISALVFSYWWDCCLCSLTLALMWHSHISPNFCARESPSFSILPMRQ